MKVGEIRFVIRLSHGETAGQYVYDTFHGEERPFESYRQAQHVLKLGLSGSLYRHRGVDFKDARIYTVRLHGES